MVYLEHSTVSKFWRCELTSDNEVTTTFGKSGTSGRSMTKSFGTSEEAETYLEKQEASKRKAGYVDGNDPDDGDDDSGSNASESSGSTKKKKTTKAKGAATTKKRKAAVAAAVSPSPSKKKKGLAGHAAPDMEVDDTEIGECKLDSGVAGVDSALASRSKVHDKLHARLVLVDPAINADKYYVLQVLLDTQPKKATTTKRRGRSKAAASDNGPMYYLFSRWGRTGTGGQAKLEGPWDKESKAEDAFCKIFKSKVGIAWPDATAGTKAKKGKYEYLQASHKNNNNSDDASWFYFLQNDPMGKSDGWYKYDDDNRVEVEQLYFEYSSANNASRLSTRFIHSESSGFTYKINLAKMTQSNTQTGTTRPIGRTEDGTTPSSEQKHQDRVSSSEEESNDEEKEVKAEHTESKPQAKSKPTKPPPKVASSSPAMKSAPSGAKSSALPATAMVGKVDPAVSAPLQNGTIYGDYDAMLNQTNLAANNNKFYKLQLVEVSNGVYLFTKWGRVGEAGATQEMGPLDSDRAIKEFEKKFKSKSGNAWSDRDNFQSKKGKYTLVEMETDAQAASNLMANAAASATATTAKKKKVLPCKQDAVTKGLIDLIFDEDMFKTAMSNLNIDAEKLPLGALSAAQIKKGFGVLERLENEIRSGGSAASVVPTLTELTSEFYTIIPHAFGRSRGPVLNTMESVKAKYDMLNTLTDIEAAQAMQEKVRAAGNNDNETETVEHPSDLNYQQLCTDLTLATPKDEDYKMIQKYFDDTKAGGYYKMKLRNIWRVDRHGESSRFAQHEQLDNRRLLWHGTNVAVVAAILKSGLRIMPHSGGRVGRGIYLADQHEKSAGYVCPSKGTAIMFLVEAALGNMHIIKKDDPSLTCAPTGNDSVLAQGRQAPPSHAELDIDDETVKVPKGKPNKVSGASNSSFMHNEFLIYKESQHRIRYVLTFDS